MYILPFCGRYLHRYPGRAHRLKQDSSAGDDPQRSANQLWKELVAQGFTGGYKPVHQWLAPRREKPGRKHSLREKDLLGLTQEEETGTTSPQPAKANDETALPSVALEAPRHLVWLLLKDPGSLDQE